MSMIQATPGRHLDLGCGAHPRNPYNFSELYGIDIADNSCTCDSCIFIKADPAIDPLPFEDSFFDSVSAYDFLEHIPRLLYVNNQPIFPFIRLMDEIHRVLKPQGKFLALTPNFPNKCAFSDPTHVNFITQDTLNYFASPHLWARMYGFAGNFSILENRLVNFMCYIESGNRQSTVRRAAKTLHSLIRPSIKQHLVWSVIANK